MQRRSFLHAILAGGVAPAFVGASVLMPVRALASSAIALPKWSRADLDEMFLAVWNREPRGETNRLPEPAIERIEIDLGRGHKRIVWIDDYSRGPREPRSISTLRASLK